MAIATIGAFAIGEYPEAVTVMLLYQVGETFQDYAVDNSKKSIENLMNIRPDFANVLRENAEIKVNPEEVKVGEIIIVKPGEKIPLDGKIIDGESMLDTTALTGESVPRKANTGDNVFSGCINQTGLLRIQVTKKFGESTVSKILNLVENAEDKKSKSENFITKFAKYYTPVVVILAVIIAIVPPIIIKEANFTEWLYRALSFLVVSCPCALVISIPLSFFAGIGGASKIGVLIKGGNYLEALANVNTVVFDKTGTLTKGVFEVQKVEEVGASKQDIIKYSAYAENYSNHPIAVSIKKAYNEKIDEKLISDINEISGKGISVKIENKQVLVGNEKLMQENNIEYTKCNEIGTVVYVSIENKYSGYILISDEIKEDSFKAIKELKDNKKQTIMLTGDKKVFQIIDHCSIFILIAGTYTPFVLCTLREYNTATGWTLFGIVWGLAILGIVLNSIDLKRYKVFSMICYILLGWCIIFRMNVIIELLTMKGFILLLAGGLVYTIGAIFYGLGKKHKWMHSVFHIACIVASTLQFFCIFFYVI